jgi:hypothetical protein
MLRLGKIKHLENMEVIKNWAIRPKKKFFKRFIFLGFSENGILLIWIFEKDLSLKPKPNECSKIYVNN